MERQAVEERVLLAIDCGTQSLRALLFSDGGDLLDRAQVPYEPYFSTKPGWAEQDPEIYWDSLCDACNQLRARSPKIFEKIAGVGVTTQRNSLINVDPNGDPLRPVVTWLDQRKAVPSVGEEELKKLGVESPELGALIAGLQAQGKSNWIMQNQPEIWDGTHKFLQVSGFLNHRLTGRFTDSVASQIGYIPFDYRRMEWAEGPDLFAMLFPVEPEKLPELVTPGEALGTVTLKAFQATGIEQGVPVIACGSDKGCETVGAGVIDETMVNLSFGTTATVQTTTKRYFEALPFMPPYPAVAPGCYNPEIMIPRGYWMLTWFKNEFGYQEVLEAEARGIAAEEILDRYLEETDPGAMGLVVQPHWGGALDAPYAKGAMIGFGEVHTKAHIYRGIIEGLGFALRDAKENMERAGELEITRVGVSGGGSQSDEICRITANIFNLPLAKGKTHEASGLGAAIITATGVGMFSSLEEATECMAKTDRVFTPDPETAEMYRNMYERVYRKMTCEPLEHLHAEIRAITGYPE
jgi:sugar (pentulose or hexulose) kinase